VWGELGAELERDTGCWCLFGGRLVNDGCQDWLRGFGVAVDFFEFGHLDGFDAVRSVGQSC